MAAPGQCVSQIPNLVQLPRQCQIFTKRDRHWH